MFMFPVTGSEAAGIGQGGPHSTSQDDIPAVEGGISSRPGIGAGITEKKDTSNFLN